jgi:hypothetical protein
MPPLALLARGLLAGLLGALVMSVAMLVLRLAAGIGLPAELVGDRFLPLLPVDTFLSMLSRLGGPIRAKELALYTGIPGQVAVGAALGVAFAVAVEHGTAPRRRAPLVAGAIVLGVWLVTLAVLWPALDSSYVGLPPGPATIVSGVGLLVAYALYGLTLAATYLWTRAEAV